MRSKLAILVLTFTWLTITVSAFAAQVSTAETRRTSADKAQEAPAQPPIQVGLADTPGADSPDADTPSAILLASFPGTPLGCEEQCTPALEACLADCRDNRPVGSPTCSICFRDYNYCYMTCLCDPLGPCPP